MKATLKDGTVLEGTEAEIAEVLKRIAAPPLQPTPFLNPLYAPLDRPVPMPGTTDLLNIIIGGPRRC